MLGNYKSSDVLEELDKRVRKESFVKSWIDFEGTRYIHLDMLFEIITELRTKEREQG